MRSIAYLALVCLAVSRAAAAEPAHEAGRAPAAASPAGAAEAACLECHSVDRDGDTDAAGRRGVVASSFARSAHKDLSCTDCHAGYEAPGPHELAPPGEPADAALLRRLSSAKTTGEKAAIGSPRAYLACGACHPGVWEDLAASPHGKWLSSERPVAGPVCASCHGSPHEVTPPPQGGPVASSRAFKAAQSQRCERCHGDPGFARAAHLQADVTLTYDDSIHGRLMATGSERAPVCVDCHGWRVGKDGHRSIGGNVAGSAVFLRDPPRRGDERVQACGQCHVSSNPRFAALVAHKPWQETHAVPRAVHVAFSWLTALTLLFFALHVLLDLQHEIRRRLSRRGEPPELDPQREVVRFDLHQRIQHWLMLAGVILLGLTGWPLRGAGAMSPADAAQRIEASRGLLAVFGGPHGAGVVHRIAAMLIVASAAYHLVYLGTLARKRRLPLSMLPTLKDALDLRDNVLFLAGLRRERPRFDRFTYLEKFDYWAVFWGVVMMVGSGFVFWFPAGFARILPTWVVTAAQIVHGEEATLAILFLFVIHFYNVHLKPSIFPMNWAWLTGRISRQALKEEHQLEYERLKDER